MKERLVSAIKVITMLGICIICITFMYIHEGNAQISSIEVRPPLNEKPTFFHKTPQEGLWDALLYYEVKHPEIVYAQALLETGHFKSNLCINHNNLFGLYDSKSNKYHSFTHWTESVVKYKEWIQYKYKTQSDYYEFLENIHYAEDSTYIAKLKQITKKYGKDKQNAGSGHNK